MDPQQTFEDFVAAVVDGACYAAAEHQENYETWTKKGGVLAQDYDEAAVHKLDNEQDRYLVVADGVEKWRDCFEHHGDPDCAPPLI